MLVSNWMSKKVVTVDENDSMHDAMKILKEYNISECMVSSVPDCGILKKRSAKKPL